MVDSLVEQLYCGCLDIVRALARGPGDADDALEVLQQAVKMDSSHQSCLRLANRTSSESSSLSYSHFALQKDEELITS
eukprot:7377650-Lingulodinium_polyedra.AAC.1